MQSLVLVLKRGLRIPKQEWREKRQGRTLAPIDLGAVMLRIWRAYRYELPERGLLVASLELDGSPADVPAIRVVAERQKGIAGVFDFQFAEPDEVRVTVRAERCWQQLGTPRRRTHQIASLRPWRPVRVLLNGRAASTSGQFYSLVEYGLVWCAGPAPEALATARLVDLQADLL